MPTYNYRCNDCERTFEAFHSMSCSSPQFCPYCNGAGKKLLSATSIIFKGSGFYTTDYRDSGYVEAKNRDKTPSSPSSGGNGSKDPTPATAAPAAGSAPGATPAPVTPPPAKAAETPAKPTTPAPAT
jgi:putative FmdB family regulatory protein